MFKKIIFLILFSLFLTQKVFAIEKPEGAVYCNGKVMVEYRLIDPNSDGRASDVDLTVNGKTKRYMTAYSWYGSAQPSPKDFSFAILGERQFDPLLVFDSYLLDAKNNKYIKCN